MFVPTAYFLDSFDRGEKLIINIEMMSNPDKGLMDASDGENRFSSCLNSLHILFVNLCIQFLHFWVKEDCCDNLQRKKGRDIVNGLVISIQTNICQQINISDEIIPFGSPISEELGNGRELLLAKCDEDLSCFYFADHV